MRNILFAKKCRCGAITVEYINSEGVKVNISMKEKLFRENFPKVRLTYGVGTYDNCNHCVNHWGIDLCGCGSGELVGKCTNGFHECRNNIPAQEIR